MSTHRHNNIFRIACPAKAVVKWKWKFSFLSILNFIIRLLHLFDFLCPKSQKIQVGCSVDISTCHVSAPCLFLGSSSTNSALLVNLTISKSLQRIYKCKLQKDLARKLHCKPQKIFVELAIARVSQKYKVIRGWELQRSLKLTPCPATWQSGVIS